MSTRTRERLESLTNYLDDPTVVHDDPDLPIVAVPLADLSWLVKALSDVETVREEYRRLCTPPGPFTQERALIERVEAALSAPAPSN